MGTFTSSVSFYDSANTERQNKHSIIMLIFFFLKCFAISDLEMTTFKF